MATSKQIDQLIATVLTRPESIYDLIELYLDDTTDEQRSYIRTRLDPIQQEIRYSYLNERSLEERIRIHLAKLSMFDDRTVEVIDSRDAMVSYSSFITTVIVPAIRQKIPILQMIRDVSTISSPDGKRRIASFEEMYRHQRHTVQKEEAQRWRQEKSGQKPIEKQVPIKSKPRSESQSFISRYSNDINLDLPRRYWLSPRFRFGFFTIFISIMAIIVIGEGEDPRTVIFLSMILLAIVALLSWTYYNKDWGT